MNTNLQCPICKCVTKHRCEQSLMSDIGGCWSNLHTKVVWVHKCLQCGNSEPIESPPNDTAIPYTEWVKAKR